MNSSNDLTPNKLFEEFDKAQNDIDFGKRALKSFIAQKDKSAFLEPTIQFLKKQKEDDVRSWGTSVLELIGGGKAFKALIDLLKEADSEEIKREYGREYRQNYRRKYRFTRFFALRAVEKLSRSDQEHQDKRNFLEQVYTDKDEDYLIRAEAAILLADQGQSKPLEMIKYMLAAKNDFADQEYWAPFRALRALREFPIPSLANEIILIMRNSNYSDHKYEAIEVLGYYTDNLEVVRALGDVVVTNKNRYNRLLAIESLKKIGNRIAEKDLIQALQDEDAEIRVQASNALKNLLKEDSVSTIVQYALKEGIKKTNMRDAMKERRNRSDEIDTQREEIERSDKLATYMIEAIRCVDPDRIISTEILSKELGSENQKRAEAAEEILTDLGGWAAVQTLSQRRNTLDKLDKLLAESEQVVKGTFESTFRQARLNFYFAMLVNIIVVSIGLVLIILAINQFMQKPEELKNWIIPGGAGTLGVLINLVFNNPRKNARSDLVALMDVNVVFLGFLRQLNEIDATFKHAYLESRDFGPDQMLKTVKQIEDTVAQTLKLAHNLILQQPPKISKKDTSQDPPLN